MSNIRISLDSAIGKEHARVRIANCDLAEVLFEEDRRTIVPLVTFRHDEEDHSLFDVQLDMFRSGSTEVVYQSW